MALGQAAPLTQAFTMPLIDVMLTAFVHIFEEMELDIGHELFLVWLQLVDTAVKLLEAVGHLCWASHISLNGSFFPIVQFTLRCPVCLMPKKVNNFVHFTTKKLH